MGTSLMERVGFAGATCLNQLCVERGEKGRGKLSEPLCRTHPDAWLKHRRRATAR